MKTTLLALLVVAVIAIVSSWEGAQYFGPRLFTSQTGNTNPPTPGHTNNTNETSLATVNLLVDFGNGTVIWFNNTKVPKDYDFYQVTLNVTRGNMAAEYYDSPIIKGYLVTNILGVGCQDPCLTGEYWSLWVWNGNNNCWNYSSQGASLLKVSTVSMVGWYYTVNSSLPGRCA